MQLAFKQRRVFEQLKRIGQQSGFEEVEILAGNPLFEYRNKLEFTFIAQRWLTPEEVHQNILYDDRRGLGFHIPGRFDWVMHIEECHLQASTSNQIRNWVYEQSRELGLTFFNPRTKQGTMRNLVLRNNRKGEWMILLVVREHTEILTQLADELHEAFPDICSLWVIVNDKVNDSFTDCPAHLVNGQPHLDMHLNRPDESTPVTYRIGPKSFFQTNTDQAEKLYSIVLKEAKLSTTDVVYDLYCGAGSIGLFVAPYCDRVVGVEYVPESIKDADVNAAINGIFELFLLCRRHEGRAI